MRVILLNLLVSAGPAALAEVKNLVELLIGRAELLLQYIGMIYHLVPIKPLIHFILQKTV